MAALLVGSRDIVKDYDYFCFMHDKKSQGKEYITVGATFRDVLWENNLASPGYITEIIKEFDNNPSLGLIVPPKIYHGTYFNDYITGFWSANFEEAEGVLNQMGIDAKISKETALRDRLISKICGITDVIINGPSEKGDFSKRLPGNISVCIKGIEGESALIMLDREGICASSGSACTSGAREPSHVLKAIGRADDEAKGSLRFTLSHHNTEVEVDRAADVLFEVVTKLRERNRF